jgi:hypothetical protein
MMEYAGRYGMSPLLGVTNPRPWAFIHGTYDPAARPVKLPRPLSARAEAFGLSLDRR